MSGLCDYSSIRWENGNTILFQFENPSGFNSYDHQDETWKRMDEHFPGNKGGIIWIPTGGGKTVIAAKWLLENAVDNGYKVIWFANRGTLLEQAAETFKGILQQHRALKNKKEICCAFVISKAAGGTNWKNLKQTSDIVFASLASSTRYIKEIRSFIETSNKGAYIVFDEVQHAYAPTYRRLLTNLKDPLSVFMIGLSATPYRMTKDESIALWKLFSSFEPSNSSLLPIHRVLQQDLIDKKILANPKFHNYNTFIEPIVEKGKKVLNQFNDLTPEANTSLAVNKLRNQLIVETYIKNFRETRGNDRFEKTIIFTPNIEGNQKLCNTFESIIREKGYHNSIKVDYIDSTRRESDRKTIVDKFRLPNSEKDSIDVLINVEMCTEGFDAPLTKTIFLARPTNSEALVRQMMGRAMRGPKVLGNEICHIVQFVDKLPEGFDLIDPEKTYGDEGREKPKFIPVPKQILKQFRKETDFFSNDMACILQYKFDYIPYGWFYFLENIPGEDDTQESDKSADVYIMFLKHQESGYDRLINDIFNGNCDSLKSMKYEDVISKYFFDCKDPLPRESLLKNVVEGYSCNNNGNNEPVKIIFEERQKISPSALYAHLLEAHLYPRDIQPSDLDALYTDNDMLMEFYPIKEELVNDLHTYRENAVFFVDNEFFDAEKCRAFIRENKKNQNPIPFSTFYHNIYQNLPELYQNPPDEKIKFIKSDWVDFYSLIAFCRFTENDIEFHLSSILHSKAFPKAIIEYILFHLTIHAAIPYEYHGPIFKTREEQFVPTDSAKQEFLNLPIWRQMDESLPENHLWPEICRQYLRIFISGITDKLKHPISTIEVNLYDYI